MAKKQNKGFTLVEIVIAIAILTLLLTPIIKQLALTMKTNRNTKAQQHAVEDAQYVMEYFQNESIDYLDSKTETYNPDGVDIYNTATVSKSKQTCDIYELYDDGSISVDPVLSGMEYQVFEYNLNDLEVNNTHTNYNRKVVLDDLTVRLMATPIEILGEEYSFKVDYNQTDAAGDFRLTNEGSLVQYDSTDTYVKAIVCKRQGLFEEKGILNPNEVNLGNVHDLDANQMPLVNGDLTNYDRQAESEFYARTMERLKNVKDPVTGKTAWEIELSGDGSSKYLGSAAYFDSMSKLTEIKIYEDDDYYYFAVNVFYENTYMTEGTPDQLEYNAFFQKFAKMDEEGRTVSCPDMYLEYQPFVLSAAVNDSVEYAAQEFIVIDNTVKGARLYLYKPKWDAVNTYLNHNYTSSGDYDNDGIVLNKSDAYYVSNDAEDMNHSVNRKKVRIAIVSANAMPADGEKNLSIYTNLNNKDVNNGSSQFVTDISATCMNGGYNINALLSKSFKIEEKTIEGEDIVVTRKKRAIFNFNKDYLLGLDDENNKEDRFFTVSVVLTPDNGSSAIVRLNGAKGGN